MDLRVRIPRAFLAVVAAHLLAAGSFADDLTLRSMAPGPQGSVLISRPVICWPVWPEGKAEVVKANMTLNGAEVTCSYSPKKRAILYRPDKPLASGAYRVEILIEFTGGFRTQKQWGFSIDPAAQQQAPTPEPASFAALRRANEIRKDLGLAPMVLAPELAAACRSHAGYMKTQGALGHVQTPGNPGYLGSTPIDRANAFGYGEAVSENIAWASNGRTSFIDQLFDAPYHRIPFMAPGQLDFGAGFADTYACVNLGMPPEEGVVMSPAAGQLSVPPGWDGFEEPDPLVVHGASGRTGYPMVVAWFRAKTVVAEVEVLTLRVLATGADVPCYLNTPKNDKHLKNALILIPKQPLLKSTTYEATLRLKLGDECIDRTWRFTTGG